MVTVTVQATDVAGNATTAAVDLSVDRTLPFVTFSDRVQSGVFFAQGEQVAATHASGDPMPGAGLDRRRGADRQ